MFARRFFQRTGHSVFRHKLLQSNASGLAAFSNFYSQSQTMDTPAPNGNNICAY
jgi:hypothetical protein